ncbi:OmpA family protein [Chitinophaga sp. MM2321]|uniref:OmpA family protein n=1 Tax=Chitinophaga sp. MM2321 TaxID=3137178 RepID=UPI0032D57C24
MIIKRHFNKALLTGGLMGVFTMVFAQEQKSALALADAHYLRYEYKQAAVFYEEAASKKNTNIAIFRKLADCYRNTNNYLKAATCYSKIITLDSVQSEDLLYYADALKSTGDYARAKEIYARYMQQGGSDASKQMAGCDSAIHWKAIRPEFSTRNLSELNTGASEWGATWYLGKQLVFTSDSLRYTMIAASKKEVGRTGNDYSKLYRVDSVGNNPNGIIIRGFDAKMNSYRYHIGPVIFSAGGDTAYLTLTNVDKGTYHGRKSYYTRRLELHYSIKKEGEWQTPEPFAYNNPAAYSLGHAALTADNHILYFTSDMPGGFGKTDIWYCEKQADGSWSNPRNCGPVINTEEEEAFPTINEEGRLYFSSKGHAGMGGFDIFSAQGYATTWSIPLNLRNGFNSEGDDFCLVKQPNGHGIFASNREGGRGDDDLYAFESLSQPAALVSVAEPKILEAFVYDSETGLPVKDAVVSLKDEDRNEMWTLLANHEGKLRWVLTDEHRFVIFATGKDHAFAVPVRFTAKGKDTLRLELKLPKAPPVVGNTFVLQNIYYDRDDYHIRPDAVMALDSLAATMERYPGMRVELAAHTDSRASTEYNLILSNRRAASAAAYLISKGISEERIIAIGYGESRLLNRCADGLDCTEEEHQQNRRTEVRILQR